MWRNVNEGRSAPFELYGTGIGVTKLVKPVLFSTHFSRSGASLAKAGLFDPILNCDSRLFIDPLLIETSGNGMISSHGHKALRDHLKGVIELVSASKSQGDAAWKAAAKRLSLQERPEICLGYGGASISGSSRSPGIVNTILKTTKEIVELGEDNPEIIPLMSMFEEGVGPDTISDLATNAILPVLCNLTALFCRAQDIPTRIFKEYGDRALPENPFRSNLPIIIVPRDILRDLPLAADWSGVSQVAFENEQLREAFNKYVGNIAKATVKDRKAALRRVALSSLSNFRAVFDAVLGSSDSYDPNTDPLNYYRFRELISDRLKEFKRPDIKAGAPSPDELMRLVKEIVAYFAQLIEKNNMWELLWTDQKPKKERAAQVLFFGVADAFCKANDVGIDPETNPGGGPVDFRFAVGYRNRVLVEVKMSTGRVVHGYKTQLKVYQEASQTDLAVFLVVNVGRLQNKLRDITRIRDAELAKSRPAPEIVVIDGRRRLSASKRKEVSDVIEDEVEDEDDQGSDE